MYFRFMCFGLTSMVTKVLHVSDTRPNIQRCIEKDLRSIPSIFGSRWFVLHSNSSAGNTAEYAPLV